MEKLKCLTALFLAVMLTACSAAPAPETAAPAPPPAESPVAESESPASAVPVALPDSIHIWQETMTGEVYWELLVIEPEEIERITALLSVQELAPLKPGAITWPDGGTPLLFALNYPESTVEACTYPQGGYRIESEDSRGTLRVGEDYYAYPGERCDGLLEFLGEQEIAIIY